MSDAGSGPPNDDPQPQPPPSEGWVPPSAPPGYPPPGYPPGSGYPPGPGYAPPGYPPEGGYGVPGPMPGYDAVPPGTTLATWGRRAGGWLIDFLILLAVQLVIEVPLHGFYRAYDAAGVERIHERPWVLVLSFVLIVAYGAVFCGSARGQTPGMMVAGTRVVNAQTGGRISYGAAAGRAVVEDVAAIILFLPWLLDVLWPVWDPRNQCLHDKAVNAVVIVV